MNLDMTCNMGSKQPTILPMDIFEGTPSPNRMPHTSEKHPKLVLEAVNGLRKRRELCDVVLVVGQKKIFGHRIVLSACCPYFHAMFTGELAESRQTEVGGWMDGWGMVGG